MSSLAITGAIDYLTTATTAVILLILKINLYHSTHFAFLHQTFSFGLRTYISFLLKRSTTCKTTRVTLLTSTSHANGKFRDEFSDYEFGNIWYVVKWS